MNQPEVLKDLLQPQLNALVEQTVTDIANGDASPANGHLRLRLAGLHVDRDDLDDAVRALTERDGLLCGAIDPWSVLETAPSVAVHNLRDFAVARADGDLADACKRIAGSTRPDLVRDVLAESMRTGPAVSDHDRARIATGFADLTGGTS